MPYPIDLAKNLLLENLTVTVRNVSLTENPNAKPFFLANLFSGKPPKTKEV